MNDRSVEREAPADGHEVHERGRDILVAQRAADLQEQVRDRVFGQLSHAQHPQHGLLRLHEIAKSSVSEKQTRQQHCEQSTSRSVSCENMKKLSRWRGTQINSHITYQDLFAKVMQNDRP